MKFRCPRLGRLALLGVFAAAPALAAPLHDAARSGKVDAVKRLIQRGADVDAENTYGLTPLLVAIGSGHNDVVQILRRNGAKSIISPEVLARIQTYLKFLGYDPGGIDGLLGSGTRNAIRAYQAQQGMEVDGRLSEDWIVQLYQDIVLAIQTRLQTLGYDPGSVDGLMGPGTRTAIRTFQEKEGLAVTAEISEDWLSALDVERLRTVQTRLKTLGYDPGPADGEPGERTRRAIREFQRQAKLAVTGEASEGLSAELDDALKAAAAARAEAEREQQRLAAEREQQTAQAEAQRAEEQTRLAAETASAAEAQRVSSIQAQLKELGYKINAVDGQLGAQTQAAIRAFQVRVGLRATGEPSDALIAKLEETIAAQAQAQVERNIKALQNPSARITQEKLLKIQGFLRVLGHDPGRADGRLGARTQGAIRAFQAQAGLPVTGEATEELYAMLEELASSKASAAKVLNNSGQRSEVSGEMRFQRSDGGDLIGCSAQNVQLDISWCSTFVSRRNTENCKVVLRPNAKVLFVKCV